MPLDSSSLPSEFTRLLTELKTAVTNDNEARDARQIATFVYRQDRAQYELASMRAKEAMRELQRCKDNLCAFVLGNAESLTFQVQGETDLSK